MTAELARRSGALHRVIQVRCHAQTIRAALEDDFHHFRLRLDHDHGRVTRVETTAPRAPYSLCGLAGPELRSLVGMRLAADASAPLRHTDARHQCTHQLDLAGIAIAAATRNVASLRYDAAVADPVDGVRHARLRRDGSLVLDWQVSQSMVRSSGPEAGQRLGSGFTRWAVATLAAEAAEAALVLRRAVFISAGRAIAVDPAATWRARPSGACWVQQPGRAQDAISSVPFRLDFSEQAEMLTSADQDWLATGAAATDADC